jgi:GlpG protein
MRQIGVLEHESLATKFSAYLLSQKIENSIDPSFDIGTEQPSYVIWVHNEDQLALAMDCFKRFQSNPSAAEFNTPDVESVIEPNVRAQEEEPVQASRPKLTLFWIFLCVMAFFLNSMQEASLRKAGFPEDGFLMTPIRFKMLYDLPPLLDKLEPIVEQRVLLAAEGKETKDAGIPDEMLSIEGTPYWRGIYFWLVSKISGGIDSLGLDLIFFKIRQGQIWRLFTPCLLHGGFLHIAFNMLWLWALGKEIDPRIGIFRSLILTLSTGIVSNTVQYLMSGPFFLGYSGVIMGLAGFIWSRQKIAPWEGYPLKRSMLIFLGVYVIGLLALQIGSFVVFLFTERLYLPNIANSAHLSGAIWGYCLGRLSFFDARGARA